MDGSTTANSPPDVGKWLRQGFRSCSKSVAMTPVGAKLEHGGLNVLGALQNDHRKSAHKTTILLNDPPHFHVLPLSADFSKR